MRDIFAPPRPGGLLKMLVCTLFGATILFPAVDIQTEFRSTALHRARPVAQMSCLMPAGAILPGVKALAHDIARRFHLRESAAMIITHAAFSAARVQGIDPTLVLAVTAIESRFKSGAINSTSGAKGLMQVLPQYHPHEVLGVGGEPSLLLIAPNINVGAAILAEYLAVTGGDLERALQRYVGAAGADHYVYLVGRERAHLSHVVQASAAL